MTTPARPFAPGQFCWTELNSEDPAGSQAFYTALFGWGTRAIPISDGATMTIFDVAGAGVSALRPLHPLAKQRGATTRWQSYLAVDDVDAALRRAIALGATVLVEAHDMGDAGRTALVKEPTGIVLALWQAGIHPGSALRNDEAGSMCWHDVYTTDLAAVKAFFTGMFDYKTSSLDLGGMEIVFFQLNRPGAEREFAILPMGLDHGAFCQPFFSVVDADATLARAVSLGAAVNCPVMDAGGGRFAHFQDPQGATFGIFEWAARESADARDQIGRSAAP